MSKVIDNAMRCLRRLIRRRLAPLSVSFSRRKVAHEDMRFIVLVARATDANRKTRLNVMMAALDYIAFHKSESVRREITVSFT